jgi:hypothetical protein
MGVFITQSTAKIINRATGEIVTGHPRLIALSCPVRLPGKPLPDGSPGPSLACAVTVNGGRSNPLKPALTNCFVTRLSGAQQRNDRLLQT